MNPPDMSDEQIVAEVRDRNKQLYSEIIRRYHTKLSHYLRKFVRQPDELEDVLQVVFIKAYENLQGFDTDRSFSSWIYRIAHNEAINHIKKNMKTSVSLDDIEGVLIDEKIDLRQSIDSTLLRSLIEEGLATLKEKYRVIFILYFFEQKSYDEISDILRIPTSTVGTLLRRAKQQMKTFIESRHYGK